MEKEQMKQMYRMLIDGLLGELGKHQEITENYDLVIYDKMYLIKYFDKIRRYPFIWVARAMIEKLSAYHQIDEDALLESAGKELMEIFASSIRTNAKQVNEDFIKKMFTIYMNLDQAKVQRYLRPTSTEYVFSRASRRPIERRDNTEYFGIHLADGVYNLNANNKKYSNSYEDIRRGKDSDNEDKIRYEDLLGGNLFTTQHGKKSYDKNNVLAVRQRVIHDDNSESDQYAFVDL